jgi:hypothetical protein
VSASVIDLSFPHNWQAEILPARPVILPARHFIYPRDAEEVERGALEVLVKPQTAGKKDEYGQPFLATCALGFRDPAVPTGIWSAPNPRELCAVSGGYAYLFDTAEPERFAMIAYRPVLALRVLVDVRLLLFVGHRSIIAWGANGQAWETAKLSDEGVTITGVEDDVLRGTGWEMISDKEKAFAVELGSGKLLA